VIGKEKSDLWGAGGPSFKNFKKDQRKRGLKRSHYVPGGGGKGGQGVD